MTTIRVCQLLVGHLINIAPKGQSPNIQKVCDISVFKNGKYIVAYKSFVYNGYFEIIFENQHAKVDVYTEEEYIIESEN